jgi:hypothetical protein
MKRSPQPRSRFEIEAEERRKILTELKKMSDEELFQIGVRAGIFTKTGRFTKPYIEEASRGTDRLADEIPPAAPRKAKARKRKSA